MSMNRAEANAVLAKHMRWSARPFKLAIAFALRGPRIIPMPVRKLPLKVVCRVCELQARWLLREGVSGA